MIRAGVAAALALAASAGLTRAFDDESNAAYWTGQRGGAVIGQLSGNPGRLPASRALVAAMVATEAKKQLGAEWAPVALRLAKIESGYRCSAIGQKTRHGRAMGVLQVLPSSAEALEPGSSQNLTDCATGIRIGVAHMRDCFDAGATTVARMAACHVGGKRMISRPVGIYARQYVALATAPWAGAIR